MDLKDKLSDGMTVDELIEKLTYFNGDDKVIFTYYTICPMTGRPDQQICNTIGGVEIAKVKQYGNYLQISCDDVENSVECVALLS